MAAASGADGPFLCLDVVGAGALAIVAGMHLLGFAIFVVIVLNRIFAFLQEYRAERTSGTLRTFFLAALLSCATEG